MIHIENINDDRVKLYRSLRKTPKSHADNNLFIAEGRIAVQKLLISKLDIISIFAVKNFYNTHSDAISLKVEDDFCFTADKELMSQITGFKLHSGIMAMAKQPDNAALKELGTRIVVLTGLINSENIGAIVRNCEAFGFDSLIFDKTSSSPFLRRAVRVSMGTVFGLRIRKSYNLIEDIHQLKSMEYHVASLENYQDAIDINTIDFPKKIALIFGSESVGIPRDILEISDNIIKICNADNSPSLNVAVASGIVLHKISSNIK